MESERFDVAAAYHDILLDAEAAMDMELVVKALKRRIASRNSP